MRAVLLIPYVISAVAASYIWRWLMHSDFGVFSASEFVAALLKSEPRDAAA